MSKLTDFFRNDLFRNVGKLLSASVIAQVIGLLVYPVLTRLYSPDDFGLLTLFLNIGNILVILATAEYHYAIVLPAEEKDARATFHWGFFLLLITSALVALSVIFRHPIAALFKSPDLARFYWLMPLLVFFMGLWNLLNYWYIRQKEYTRISGYQFSLSILSAGSKLGFGYAGFLSGGMIWSMVIAPALSSFLSISLAFRKAIRPLFGVDKSSSLQMAKTYRNFPLFTLPRDFVNLLVGQLPVFVLTPCFGTRDVGFWGMAVLLGFAPVSMITKALYQVLYQYSTARVHEKQPLMPVMRRFTRWTTLVVVPGFILLYFILPWLTRVLFGAEWVESGYMIRWMLPWLYAVALTSSTCFLSDVFMKQKLGLYFEILLAVLRVLGVALGIWLGSFTWAIAGYCIGSFLAVMAQYLWLISLCRDYDKSLNATS
ncbi:MAG: oligosaccharide flippase family protein [Bacteroidales bacterium]|nr:oligosaccharide flippase family protein [Candidatus Colicola faecequi]